MDAPRTGCSAIGQHDRAYHAEAILREQRGLSGSLLTLKATGREVGG